MRFVPEDIEKYCVDHSSIPSAHCREIDEYTRAHVPHANMVSGPLAGAFLGFLVRLIGAKRALEIGCFTGYSALTMAEALPPEGEVITLDINPETDKLARGFWAKSPQGKKIRSIVAPALSSLETLKGPFDIVFIDADKENYVNYLKRALPMLSHKGLIVVDNTLWGGEVLQKSPGDEMTRGVQALNDFVHEHPELESVLVPIRDGMLIVRKK